MKCVTGFWGRIDLGDVRYWRRCEVGKAVVRRRGVKAFSLTPKECKATVKEELVREVTGTVEVDGVRTEGYIM